jgi:hypothetical protein
MADNLVNVQLESPSETRLIARIERFPPELRARLIAHWTPVERKMLALVHAGEPIRTGRLREETRGFLDSGDEFVRARVRVLAHGSAAGKAGALEYGGHGIAQVRPHAQTLAHAWSEMIEPRRIMVSAYKRRVNIRELRFLRDAEAAARSEGTAAIEAAVRETVKS